MRAQCCWRFQKLKERSQLPDWKKVFCMLQIFKCQMWLLHNLFDCYCGSSGVYAQPSNKLLFMLLGCARALQYLLVIMWVSFLAEHHYSTNDMHHRNLQWSVCSSVAAEKASRSCWNRSTLLDTLTDVGGRQHCRADVNNTDCRFVLRSAQSCSAQTAPTSSIFSAALNMSTEFFPELFVGGSWIIMGSVRVAQADTFMSFSCCSDKSSTL